ncbi:MAG: hypothetical protein V1744_02620 [Candidatus Altiarchaeota archaeon]
MTAKRALTLLLLLPSIASACYDAAITPAMVGVMDMIRTFGYPLGLFMLIYMGLKWMTSEGPEERDNARRGIIYMIIGLLLLKVGWDLVLYLLCF